LKTYDQFANDYALNPDAEIAKMDDEEAPPEPETLRRDVLMRRQRALKLQDQIPESIVVSMFQIDCKSIRTTLADKHLKIAKAEVELIAKQAKITSNKIMAEFDTKDLKIIAVPNNIEELSEIKSYMGQVPQEIEKLGQEIKKCTDIYDMLNEFQYAFNDEDDADKRWRMFGSPQETIQKIARQNVTLDKEKEKFVAQMQNQQADYDQKVHMVTQEVAQFIKNEDINAFEQIANDARDLWTRLGDICDSAKTFNVREQLTENEETSYEPVFQLQKDFRAFYDLWTTIDNYRQSEKRWRHDDFELLNSEELENTVDESNRVLARAIGIFRGKSLVAHQKMAEKVKEEVLDFRQYVGMAMAMRTDGIQPRHWTKISAAVGFDVKPFDGFNL
jgi:dynein heavy chain